MRVAFTTLGCKINQYETDLMRQDALLAGNSIVSFADEADLYVINTCSVTAKSDYQCRQAIKTAIRKSNGARVVVTGCYAETRPEELKTIPGVSLVFGNREKDGFSRLLSPQAPELPSSAVTGQPMRVAAVRGARTRGYLKIQDGCDNQCAYCIVPLARGKARSAAPEDILREFDQLVASGCPEIVLTGIHIGTYGADLQANMNLTQLIDALGGKRRQARIRLSSIEPKEITPEIIGQIGKALCRHLHIPLQSGDNVILSAMNRNYTAEYYHDLLHHIAQQVPDIALGADVMVGFPGEGDQEFENTFNFLRRSSLTHFHVFSFSPRPGTKASDMGHQVPEKVKKDRSEALRELGNEKNYHFRRRFLERQLPVVVENAVERHSGLMTGFTDNYIKIAIKGAQDRHIGQQLPVRIIDVSKNLTIGEV